MSKQLPSPELSNVAIAIVIGSMLGILAATAYHLLHDHSQYAPAELVQHFIPELVAFAAGGALLSAIIAVVFNYMKRKR